MPQVTIENPIFNSSYKEPCKNFKFSDDGITDEIVESRRVSSYFVPIAKPKKKAGGKPLALESEWTQDRVEENEFINRVREHVSVWRKGYCRGITNTTRQLIEYWKTRSKNCLKIIRQSTSPDVIGKDSKWKNQSVYWHNRFSLL